MGKSLLKLLFVLLLVGTVQTVYAQEPYAVLSENNTVLTFYYDGDKVSKNGYGIGPFELTIRVGVATQAILQKWSLTRHSRIARRLPALLIGSLGVITLPL